MSCYGIEISKNFFQDHPLKILPNLVIIHASINQTDGLERSQILQKDAKWS